MMMERRTVAIVGLGLIGGSMALALRRRTGHRLIGIDRNPAACEAALQQEAVDEAGGPALLASADIVVLALAPQHLIPFITENIDTISPGTIVTDVCGVKHEIVSVCEPICEKHGLFFVGGHPMAGKEHSGFGNADADLFVGASYILTPTDQTNERALDMIKGLASQLGCTRLTVTTPQQHDRVIAFTSQLPHVLAGAYVTSPTCPQYHGFSAGSYRDVSRVATVDEHLWSRLFLLNAGPLCDEIDGLIERLSQYREAIASRDCGQLENILAQGRRRKEENP